MREGDILRVTSFDDHASPGKPLWFLVTEVYDRDEPPEYFGDEIAEGDIIHGGKEWGAASRGWRLGWDLQHGDSYRVVPVDELPGTVCVALMKYNLGILDGCEEA